MATDGPWSAPAICPALPDIVLPWSAPEPARYTVAATYTDGQWRPARVVEEG